MERFHYRSVASWILSGYELELIEFKLRAAYSKTAMIGAERFNRANFSPTHPNRWRAIFPDYDWR